MKLCSLHFKNLNSLAGEWTVNFEAPEFSTGLFAITGPTGAGKTTLLDAFCLSLFGRTPRLDHVNASGNEIMTRGTAECCAESEFIIEGKRYCASWSQRKTQRRDGTEKLQQPKCRFSQLLPDEKVLADSVSSMSAAVEKICRLDFERFTRTVVLPQGGFAAFLQAGGKDRAKILEDLTGAEVYRDISRKVFEMTRSKKENLERDRLALGEMLVMEESERVAVEKRVAESSAKETGLREAVKTLRAASVWYDKHDELEERLAVLRREQDENAAAAAAFEEDAARLALAERAKTIDDLYAELRRSREKLAAARAGENEARAAAVKHAAEVEAAAKAVKEATAACEAVRLKAEQAAALWVEVSALDRDLAARETELAAAEKKAQESSRTCVKHESTERGLRAEREAAEADRAAREREAAAAIRALEEARVAESRASLSELRGQLVEGQPCPLCGAVHHPMPCGGEDGAEEHYRLHEAVAQAHEAEQAAGERFSDAREKIVRLDEQLRSCEATLADARQASDEAHAAVETIRAVYGRLRAQRLEKGGDKSPDAEMRRLKRESDGADGRCREAQDRLAAAKVACARAESQCEHQTELAAELTAEGCERQKAFDERLKRLGFRDEAEWRAAVIPEDERERLAARRDEISKRGSELAVLVPRTKAELAACGQPPAVVRDGIGGRIDECEKKLAELLTGRGADVEALARDDENRIRRAKLGEDVRHQESVCAVWRELCGYIGSAKGDLFSRYVQGLTFRRLVRAANAQLEGLSDRYRLRPAQDDALALDVLDLWQGGAVRSAKNLSGGESFIVSLALALALSHGMRDIKVDSLFLDEGFGTLDENSLETVLECLNRLREKGRLVGVISHVKALQESIDCRIAVVPEGNGRSCLKGPGCSKR